MDQRRFRSRYSGNEILAYFTVGFDVVCDSSGRRHLLPPDTWVVFTLDGRPQFTIENEGFRQQYEEVSDADHD